MEAKARRDERRGRWILHLKGPGDDDFQALPTYPVLVRMIDAAWQLDPDARLQGQARVERAWVTGQLLEVGHGECQLEDEPRQLVQPTRVRFEWRRRVGFFDEDRQLVNRSTAVELRPDGSAWQGEGFYP